MFLDRSIGFQYLEYSMGITSRDLGFGKDISLVGKSNLCRFTRIFGIGRETTSFHIISGLFLGHIIRSIRFQLVSLRFPWAFPGQDMYNYRHNFQAFILLWRWGDMYH